MAKSSWIGQTIGGRYIIEEMLGRGGMSTVYKARDPNLRRVVAVKLIHPHLSDDPRFVSRFEEEATAIAQLRHPNIVQVFDFNSDGDTYYMVMEFVPGETLQERLNRMHNVSRQLPARDAVRYARQVSDALSYAHKRGMIHRDIKPANIMLDVQDQVILMDFGIVKMIGSERHTATGAVVGTAMYMSPEMIRGESPDPRADIYSLGVTLYEMVNGEAPFKADSAMTLMMMHLHDPIPDLRKLHPEVPEELVEVIEKSLQKDRTARFASAAEMESTLQQVQEKLGGGALPATVLEPSPESGKPAPRIEAAATLVDPLGDQPPRRDQEREGAAAGVAASAASDAAREMSPGNLPVGPDQSEPPVPTTGHLADSPPVAVSSAAPAASNAAYPPLGMLPNDALSPGGPDKAANSPLPAGGSGSGVPLGPGSSVQIAVGGKRPVSPTILLVAAGVVLLLLLGAGAIGFLSGQLTGRGQAPSPTTISNSTTQAAVVVPLSSQPTETTQPSPTDTSTQEPPTATVDLKAFYETLTPPVTASPTANLRNFYDTLTPQASPSAWVPPAPLYARITGISIDNYNTRYIVNYETYGYTEKLPGMHVHFFFDTVSQENAGIPGSGPWILYGGPRPFTQYLLTDKPAGATQMCALVAHDDHTIIPDSGNCFSLP